jgi:hypothetical protein
MRALLVALLVATPSLLLSQYAGGAREVVALIAISAAVTTFLEYISHYPSFVEFRDAPPINRIRFVSLFAMVFMLSILGKHQFEPTNLTAALWALGNLVGQGIDFPYSPVRLVVLLLPPDAPVATFEIVRAAAGLSYLIALSTVGVFIVTVRVFGWPTSNGAFNVWVNLPLFDPTAGGDVVSRLQRDARINIILGALLPFLIPAVVKTASDMINPVSMTNPQTLVWMLSAWAFLPASMITRGIALSRIAELIEEKRRRTYANAETVQTA